MSSRRKSTKRSRASSTIPWSEAVRRGRLAVGDKAWRRSRRVYRRTMTPKFTRQLRGLVHAQTKDASDADRSSGLSTAVSQTFISCLTSDTAYGSASSSSGLLACTGDEALINWIRVKGSLRVFPGTTGTTQPLDTMARFMVIWMKKPLLVASAAGTLPPATEWLNVDNTDALPVHAVANSGRFVILSDRTYNLGTHQPYVNGVVTDYENTGRQYHPIDFTIKVNRRCKFKKPAQIGSPNQGGHYDSDIEAGQVVSGLLLLYQHYYCPNYAGAGAGTTVQSSIVSRLNYTA